MRAPHEPPHDDELVLAGASPAAARFRAQLERVARTPGTTVLLLAARGAGAARVARRLHRLSPATAEGPFLSLDGGARAHARSDMRLDGGRLDGEVRLDGSTAALDAHAAGGTLYVHEVACLTPALQAELAELLERRASGETSGPRIVASTTRDLEERVEAGTFREDLYYRLNVLTLRVPALRERPADVPELARELLRRIGSELGTAAVLTEDACEALAAHGWPGNLLELEAVLRLAALRAEDGEIRAEQLELDRGERVLVPVAPAERSLRAAEEALIRRVLREERGNRSRAARVLGINRTTLYSKLRLYGIR